MASPQPRRSVQHTCEALYAEREGFEHRYGAAIDTIDYVAPDETYPGNGWGAGNGEYRTPIAYCPFCGLKLARPADS